jgi:phage FluMu protein Com
MVAMVKALCARCGPIELPVESASVMVPTAAGTQALLEFDCPRCGAHRTESLDERATMLLLHAGVTVGAAAAPLASRVGPASPEDAD